MGCRCRVNSGSQTRRYRAETAIPESEAPRRCPGSRHADIDPPATRLTTCTHFDDLTGLDNDEIARNLVLVINGSGDRVGEQI